MESSDNISNDNPEELSPITSEEKIAKKPPSKPTVKKPNKTGKEYITINNRLYQSFEDDDDEEEEQERSSMPYKLTLVGSGASIVVIFGAILGNTIGVAESVSAQIASAGSQALVGTISGGFALSQAGNKGKKKRKKKIGNLEEGDFEEEI